MNVFNHKHEITTGRTSSISHQIMGFDSKGQIVNYSENELGNLSWKQIIDKSSKVVTFIDLAGHEKYLKTTVYGMTGSVPDYSLIVIGANMGVTRMTKEHIGLSIALKLPMIFVVTKIDICPENVLKETLNSINKILKLPGVRKLPYMIKNEDDVITCSKNVVSDRISPIFLVSHVTGENLDLLKQFINLLPLRRDWESQLDKKSEYFIDQTFYVTGVGTVVSGIVTQGTISVNDTLTLGPDGNGLWKRVQIKGIHCKRNQVKSVHAGQTASLALRKEKRANIRKGMVMVEDENPDAVWEFAAEVLVLYHSTTISSNYQPVIHCMCVRQCAKIVSLFDKDSLRTGDKAKVKFRFMFRPEYIKVGERLIFREGRTKGLGVITEILTTCNDEIKQKKLDSDKKKLPNPNDIKK
jgi:GTPase